MTRRRGGAAVGVTVLVVLVALGAAVGAYVGQFGWRPGDRDCVAEAIVLIPAVEYHLLREPTPRPALPGYVDGQVRLITSARVLEKAMDDPAWRQAPRPMGAPGETSVEFTRRVSVRRRGESLLRIRFRHPDPAVAAAGAAAVTRAYAAVAREIEQMSHDRRRDLLETARQERSTELSDYRKRIAELAKDYGTDDLNSLYRVKQEQVARLESTILDAKLTLAEARDARGGDADATGGGMRWAPQPPPAAATRPGPATGVDRADELQRRLDRYEQLFAAVSAERVRVGNLSMQVADWRAKADDAKRRCDEVARVLEELRLDQMSGSGGPVVLSVPAPAAPNGSGTGGGGLPARDLALPTLAGAGVGAAAAAVVILLTRLAASAAGRARNRTAA